MIRLPRCSSLLRAFGLLCATSAATFSFALAAPFEMDLQGNTSHDEWRGLITPNYPGTSFIFSSNPWPTTGNWTAYDHDLDPSTVVKGGIGSNTALSGDAVLYKVVNGTGGGPYPASASIYFGGFDGAANIFGGTLAAGDITPLANLQTATFQVEIGAAFGYDFYNATMPTLSYTTESGGTGTLLANFSSLIFESYRGDILMPTGYEAIYVKTWGVQFDLSNIEDPVTSINLTFSAVQHAQLYGLQLDQSDVAYTTSAFPVATAWDGGAGNLLWSNSENWSTNLVPTDRKMVALNQGTGVTLDTDQTIFKLNMESGNNFNLSSQNGATLTVGEGGIATSVSQPGVYTISAPLNLQNMPILAVAAGTELVISGLLTANGFVKKNAGTVRLTGNTVFTGNSYGNVVFGGGQSSISGQTSYTGAGLFTALVKDSTLTLHGGDNRLTENFVVQLASNRIITNSAVVSEVQGILKLGDATGKSDQVLAGLRAEATTEFNQETGYQTYAPTTSTAKVVGGSAATSELTLKIAAGSTEIYLGHLGGTGQNENNLAITKTGDGTQALGGTSTYSGDTRVEGGMLSITNAGALSINSNLVLAGGVLGLGSGNYSGALGTGAGQVSFEGDGGFSATGAARTVNLGGAGAAVTWGAGNFVGNGKKLLFSHASANNTLIFANAINLGSEVRTIEVNNGSSVVDAQLTGALTGTGGLNKTGAGTLETTAENTYTGGTSITGALFVSGLNGSLDKNVQVNGGGTLQLTNTSAANNTNRIENDAVVTLRGGTFNFSVGTGASYSETVGELKLAAGGATVTTGQAATGFTSVLTFGSLTREATATVNFLATTLGTRNSIIFTAEPVLTNGIIGGWATVNSEFATYGINGVVALATYNTGGESTWASSDNVKLSAGSAALNTTLTQNRQINSLNIVGPGGTGTYANTLNLGGYQLRIGSGGILNSGGASNRLSSITGGTLTAGTADNTAGELIFSNTSEYLQVNASIADNGSGAVSVIKAGGSNLTLSGANTFSGGVYANQGILYLGHAQALGTGRFTLNQGAYFGATGTLTLTTNNSQTWDGDVTFYSNGNMDMGSGKVLLTGDRQINMLRYGLTVGGFEGAYKLTKVGTETLTINGTSTHTGGTDIVAGTLVAAKSDALGTGETTVRTGSTLRVDAGATVNNSIVLAKGATLNLNGTASAVSFQGGTLNGSGTLNQAVTVGGGSGAQLNVLSPGNSPGSLTTGTQTWTAGGTFLWEVSATNLSGSNIGQGTTYDYTNILGTLDLTSLTEGAFDIDIKSLTASNQAGLLAGFDLYDDYEWTILTASGGITGFEATDFNLDATGFANAFTGGSFSLGQSGNSLVLSYTGAVPEPGRALLLLFGLCSAILRRRR